MTIAIALQVHDGIVLASDSASTLIDTAKPAPDNVLNVYNNANKIFNLCKGFPIGALTFSAGSIGPYSISTLAKDLRRRFSGEDPAFPTWHLDAQNFTIEQVAVRCREFLYDEHWVKQNIPPSAGTQLGFVVAGHSAGIGLSEAWLIEISQGQCAPPKLLFAPGATQVYAGGDPEVFSRLVLGHGAGLENALLKAGVAQASIAAVILALQAELQINLIAAAMPIQDAIDFAEFLVETTARFARFKFGAATVGGPTESAAITKHEGFKWVRRKHYFDETLNPRHMP